LQCNLLILIGIPNARLGEIAAAWVRLGRGVKIVVGPETEAVDARVEVVAA
jgi:hypothetical protein